MLNKRFNHIMVYFMVVTLITIDLFNIILGFNRVDAVQESRSQTSASNVFSGSFSKPANFRNINSVTTNNGTLTYSENPNSVDFTAKNGSGYQSSVVISGVYTPSSSMYISNYPSSYYNSGGYYGSLSQYVVSGEASSSRYISGSSSSYYSDGKYSGSLSHTGGSAPYWTSVGTSCSNTVTVFYDKWGGNAGQTDNNKCGQTRSFNVNGQTVTIGRTGDYESGSCGWTGPPNGSCSSTWTASWDYSYMTNDTRTYSGTVYSADTRVWAYHGTVTKPASDTRVYQTHYSYIVNMDYTLHANPIIQNAVAAITAPNKSINVSGSVSDANGDTVNLTAKLINSSGVVVNTLSNVVSTKNSFDFSIPTETYPSGTYTVLISGIDDYGYATANRQTNSIVVDNTAPAISFSTPASLNSTDTTITTSISDVSAFKSRSITLKNLANNTTVSTVNPTAQNTISTVSNNGIYNVVATATDVFNNASDKTSATFEIKRPATVISDAKPLIQINKFQVIENTNLDSLFNLYEWTGGENITYRIVTNPTGIASGEIVKKNGVNYLKVTGLKQGTTTLSAYAKNSSGFESIAKNFEVAVVNRPSVITVSNDYPVVVENNNLTGLGISGTVLDEDKDVMSVTGRLSDINSTNTKITSIDLTQLNSVSSNWALDIPTSNFVTGVYYGALNVVANDTFVNSVASLRSAPIVLVKNATNYNSYVDLYTSDLGGTNILSWTSDNHNALFAVYEAVQLTEENPLNISMIRSAYTLIRDGVLNGATKPKLADGQTKQEFLANLSDQAFDWLKLNFANATVLDYEIIDSALGVNANTVKIVNDLAHKHYLDKGDAFTKTELTRVVNLAKGIYAETLLNTVEGWLNQVTIKNNFLPGAKLNVAAGKYIETGMMEALYKAPNKFTNGLLQTYFKDELKKSITIVSDNEKHYQLHFKDTIALRGKPTVSNIVSIVESTNSTISDYNNFLSNPIKTNSDKLNNSVNRLNADTNYQTSWKEAAYRLSFIEFIYNIEEKIQDDFYDFGLTDVNVEAETLYPTYINRYVKDKNTVNESGKPLINKTFNITDTKLVISDDFKFNEADTQKVIDLVNALRGFEKDANTLEVIESKLVAFTNTNQIYIEGEKEKIQLIWNKVNNQNRIKKVTNYELSKLNVTDLLANNNIEYTNNLYVYRPAITTSKWTLSDIQLVVNVTNSYLVAERTPSTTTISAAHVAVDTLNKTSVQTQLYKNLETRLENVAIKYIVSQVNSNKAFSIIDINNTNVTGMDGAYLNDYILLLTDEIKRIGSSANNLTKAQVQNLLNDYTNIHLKNYKNFIVDKGNAPKLNALIISTKALNTSKQYQLYDEYNPQLSPFALQHLFISPSTTDKLIYGEVGLTTYSPDKLDFYASLLPLYPKDITDSGLAAVFTIPLLQNSLIAIEEFEKLVNTIDLGVSNGNLGSDDNVASLGGSKKLIDKLILDGDLKTELIGNLEGVILDKLNQSRFSLTTNAILDFIGITDLESSSEAFYKQMLIKYKTDVRGNYVSLEEIQSIIELSNRTNELLAKPVEGIGTLVSQDFTNLIKFLETYPNGTMRSAFKDLIDNKIIDYINANAADYKVTIQEFVNLYLLRMSDDLTIRAEYMEYLIDLVNAGAVTKQGTQLLVDTINSLIAAEREIERSPWETAERKFLDQIGTAIDNLVEGPYKNKHWNKFLTYIVSYLNAGTNASKTIDTELYRRLGASVQSANALTYNEFVQQYVNDNNRKLTQSDFITYIDSINSYVNLRDLIQNVSPTISGTSLENFKNTLISEESIMNKLINGSVETQLNNNVYNLTLSTINTTPEKINAGLARLAKLTAYIEIFKAKYVEGIKDTKVAFIDKPLTTNDIQLIVNVVNVFEDYIESYNNKITPETLKTKIDNVLVEIHKLPNTAFKDKYLAKHKEELLNLMLVFPEVMNTHDLIYTGFTNILHRFEEDYRDFMYMYQPLNVSKMQKIIDNTTLLENVGFDLTDSLLSTLNSEVNKLESSVYKTKMTALYNMYDLIREYEKNPNAEFLLNSDIYSIFAELSDDYNVNVLNSLFGINLEDKVKVNRTDISIVADNTLERQGHYALKMIQANNERLIVPYIYLESDADVMWNKIDSILEDGDYKDRLLVVDVESVFIGLVSKTPTALDMKWFNLIGLPATNTNLGDYVESITSRIYLVYRELTKIELKEVVNFVDKAQLIEDKKQSNSVLLQYYNEIKGNAKSVWESERLTEIKKILGL